MKTLDEIMSEPRIFRKVSNDKTEECPIWNEYDQLWEESDAQLRERIKECIKNDPR